MRILMIEDDEKLCASVKFQLEKQGFSVDVCHDGEEGLFLIKEGAHDLILLDRMLPGIDGIRILQNARNSGVCTPVIMITALGELSDRVLGLDTGADDYIVKPFAFEELTARIRSALRRPLVFHNEHLSTFGDLCYDSMQKLLTCGSISCSLSRREGDLMELFLRNPNQTLPRLLIITRVWGPEADVEDGNLDNYIYFLRRRLKSLKSFLAIKAVRGVGYRLEAPNA
ncbi:MAG: response regulator transcription factor [Eubacteriales bacterium]|nr:response regulator transcription factor [Eubacteriales bacterium]